jgi:hypothetical protein
MLIALTLLERQCLGNQSRKPSALPPSNIGPNVGPPTAIPRSDYSPLATEAKASDAMNNQVLYSILGQTLSTPRP